VEGDGVPWFGRGDCRQNVTADMPMRDRRGYTTFTMSLTIAAAVCMGGWIAAAALARGPTSAHVAFAIPVLLLPLPWFVSAPDFGRVLVAFAIGILFMSAADFAARRRPQTFISRLTYIIAFAALIDSTSGERVPQHLDRRTTGRIVVALCVVTIAIAFWNVVSPAAPVVRTVVRVLLAAVMILAMAEATGDLVRVVSELCGVRFAAVHDHPYRSKTLSEFWSRRWNRTAARWFRQYAFLPARAAGIATALFALFAVSGIMHAYLVAAVIPLPWMVTAFFLAQPILLLAERQMRMRQWPDLAARTWTIATLTALLPLLLIPLGFSL